MSSINKTVYLLLSLFGMVQIKAQIDDWQLRPSISLNYNINDKWSVEGTYYMYLNHNMGAYNKSEIGTEVLYRANPWLQLGIDYRHTIESGGDGHELRYFGKFDHQLSEKWNLEYRVMLQQEFEPHSAADYFWRNKITLGYDLVKNVEVYAFTETYLKIEGGLDFHRQKSGLGAEFEIGNRNKIDFQVQIRNKRSQPTESRGHNEGRVEVGFTHTFK